MDTSKLLNIKPLKEVSIMDTVEVMPEEEPLTLSKAQKQANRKERQRLENIEDQKIILRDRLTRELELSKRTQKLCIDGWQDLCCQIKVEQFRKELVTWGEQANRLMDRKNNKIELLLHDIDASQDMLKRGQSKTKEIAGFIKGTYDILLKTAENLYEFHSHEMFKNFAKEMKRRTNDVNFMKDAGENTAHAINVRATDDLKDNYDIFCKKRESIINSEIEKRYSIRDSVVAQMQEMHDQLIAFVAGLRSSDENKLSPTDMGFMNESQKEMTKELKTLTAEEVKYTGMINKLEKELLSDETKANAEINDLNLELVYFQNVRQKLADNLDVQNDVSKIMLKKLCVECYEIKHEFDKFVKTGELLLSLSANCRKLQTKAELALPCGEIPPLSFDSDVDEKFKIELLDMKKHFDMSEEDILEQKRFLSKFLRRISMVEAQNMLLLEEKRKLIEKRDKYINFIKLKMKTDDLDELLQVTSVGPQYSHPCQNYKLKSNKK